MILKFLLGAVLLFTLFTLIHKYKKATPVERRNLVIKIVLGAVVVAVVIGSLTGRVPLVAGFIAIAATVAKFGLRWGLPAAKIWLAKSGGNATFKSEHLIVSVNVTSGQFIGKILKGEHANRNLSELNDQQLQDLLRFFGDNDKKSFYLISAYIKSRGFTFNTGSTTQQTNNEHGMPSNNRPEIEESLEILGFNEMPTKKDIIEAHRRLISKLHPDKGGSDYLAARVNQARDVLLNALK